ncbi:hypothetical protein D3C85_1816510 [compost metagenome]
MITLTVIICRLLVNRVMVQHVAMVTGNDNYPTSLASCFHYMTKQGHGFKRPIDLNL